MVIEKRTTTRFAFSKKEEVRVVLVPAGEDTSYEGKILNCSSGGLGLAVSRQAGEAINEDMQLYLQSVAAQNDLTCLQGHRVRVKWVLDYEQLANVGIGCEFVDISNECLQKLEALAGGGR